MKFWNRIWSWVRTVARRSQMEHEMDAELRFHIEAFAEDLVRGGVPGEEAWRRARLEFGGIERAKEECRDASALRLVDRVARDLRFGLRLLIKNPGSGVCWSSRDICHLPVLASCFLDLPLASGMARKNTFPTLANHGT